VVAGLGEMSYNKGLWNIIKSINKINNRYLYVCEKHWRINRLAPVTSVSIFRFVTFCHKRSDSATSMQVSIRYDRRIARGIHRGVPPFAVSFPSLKRACPFVF
jgi:hypothetical protein